MSWNIHPMLTLGREVCLEIQHDSAEVGYCSKGDRRIVSCLSETSYYVYFLVPLVMFSLGAHLW